MMNMREISTTMVNINMVDMKKFCMMFIAVSFLHLLYACNNTTSYKQAEENLANEMKHVELHNPQSFIEVDGEIVDSDRLLSSKSIIRGHIRSRAEYTKYTNTLIRVSLYSKNHILIGTEDIYYSNTLSSNYDAFQKKVKLPHGVASYSFEVVKTIAHQ